MNFISNYNSNWPDLFIKTYDLVQIETVKFVYRVSWLRCLI